MHTGANSARVGSWGSATWWHGQTKPHFPEFHAREVPMWGLPGESLVRHTEGRSGATAHGYCHLSPGSPDCRKATTNSTPHNQGPRQPPWLLVQLHMLKQQRKRPAAAKTTTSPPGPQRQRQGKHSGDSVCPPGLQLMLVGSILPLFPLMYMLPHFSTAYPVHFNLQHQMQWQHLTETGWKAPIEV